MKLSPLQIRNKQAVQTPKRWDHAQLAEVDILSPELQILGWLTWDQELRVEEQGPNDDLHLSLTTREHLAARCG